MGQTTADVDVRRVEDHTNECLALMRAFYVGELLAEAGGLRRNELTKITFDESPFMANLNDRMDGELYRALGLADTVAELSSELELPTDTTHRLASGDRTVQRRISEAREKFDQRLYYFRSVVVMVTGCQNVTCEI